MKPRFLLLSVSVAAVLSTGCVSTIHESDYRPERVAATERTVSRAPYRVSELTLVTHEEVLQYWKECNDWKPGAFDQQVKASQRLKEFDAQPIASWFGTKPGEETPAMIALYRGLLSPFGNERVKSFGLPGCGLGIGTVRDEDLWRLVEDAKLIRYGWPKKLTAESLTARLASMYPGTFSADEDAKPLHVLLTFSWDDRDYDAAASMAKGKNGIEPGAGTQNFGVWVLSGTYAKIPGKNMPKPGKEFRIEYHTSGSFGGDDPDSGGEKVQIRTKTLPAIGHPQQSSAYCEFVESAVAAAVVDALNGLPDDLFGIVVGQ